MAHFPSSNPLLLSWILPFLFFLSPVNFPVAAAETLYTDCGDGNYTVNSTFETNLNALLPSLAPKAASHGGFITSTEGVDPDKVYALFLCRGDIVATRTCEKCLRAASKDIKKQCANRTAAAAWYEYCLLRYSPDDFFGLMEDAGKVTLYNTENVTDRKAFRTAVKGLLANLSSLAVYDKRSSMFAAGKVRLNSSDDTLYGLVQCTKDLSPEDCNRCLEGGIGDLECCYFRRGARVLSTSCALRFELYLFYRESIYPLPPPPPTPTQAKGSRGKNIAIVVLAVVSTILIIYSLTSFFWRRMSRKKNEGALLEMKAAG